MTRKVIHPGKDLTPQCPPGAPGFDLRASRRPSRKRGRGQDGPPRAASEAGLRLEDCPENFRDAHGRPYLVRCPACGRENYTPAVADGVCAWCGWRAA